MSDNNYQYKYLKYKKKYLDLKYENEGGVFKALKKIGNNQPSIEEEERYIDKLRDIFFTGLNKKESEELFEKFVDLMGEGIFVTREKVIGDFSEAWRNGFYAIPLINKLFFLNKQNYEIDGKKVNVDTMYLSDFIIYVKKNLGKVKFQKMNQMADIVLDRYKIIKSLGIKKGNLKRKKEIYEEYAYISKFLRLLSKIFGLSLKNKKEEESKGKQLLEASRYFYKKYLEKLDKE